jgi:hypothetical protein
MSDALIDALSTVENTIAYAFDIHVPPNTSCPAASLPSSSTRATLNDKAKPVLPTLETYSHQRNAIRSAEVLLKKQLETIQDSLERRKRQHQHVSNTFFTESNPSSPCSAEAVDEYAKEVFGVSLFAVSLLHVCAQHNIVPLRGGCLTH